MSKSYLLAVSFLSAVSCLTTSGGARADCPVMTREQIANLAQSAMGYSYWWGHGRWRMDGTSHGSCSGSCPDCTHTGSYGADCSGLAGKVWQVPRASDVTEDYHPYSTTNFRNDTTYWTQVSRGSTMYRGDAVVYNSNGSGHIMIYDSGNAWGTPVVWECKGCSYGCVHGTHSVSSSYIGIRRKNIQSQPVQGQLVGVVYVDKGSGSADMTERLPGTTVTAGGETTTARDGDAYWSFDLNPGSYTATASKSGYVANSRSCEVTEGGETWCSIGLVPACTPDCAGKQCGSDGCGGSCGSCGANESCVSGQCVCQPQCGGRVCGPDPACEMSCGTCPAGHVCNEAGACSCVPDCNGRACGPDPVCGTSCGECPPGQLCDLQGLCLDCQPDCQDLACGPDPVCGESCGDCPSGQVCENGQCVACTPDCTGRGCGLDPLCGTSCGTCPAELICDATSGSCLEIPAGKGKLFGLVVEKPDDAEADLHDAPPIERATVRVDGEVQTATDKDGYYELLVEPGEHDLSAIAEGYGGGSATCTVEERGSCECMLALEKTPHEIDPDEITIVGGCHTASGGSLLLLLVVLAGLLSIRRPSTRSPG